MDDQGTPAPYADTLALILKDVCCDTSPAVDSLELFAINLSQAMVIVPEEVIVDWATECGALYG